jgi:hypothetical protein
MKAVGSSGMSEDFYWSTWCYMPEGSNTVYSHYLKSKTYSTVQSHTCYDEQDYKFSIHIIRWWRCFTHGKFHISYMLTFKVQFLLTKTDYLSIKISPSPFKAFLLAPRVSLTGNLIINISLFCYVLYVQIGWWPLNMKLQTEKEAVLNDIASLSDGARSLRTNTTHTSTAVVHTSVPCHNLITR